MTAEQKIKAISRLTIKYKSLKSQLEALLAEPASYSISGSVSATNRNADDLRKEMDSTMRQIKSLFLRKTVVETSLPDYRWEGK